MHELISNQRAAATARDGIEYIHQSDTETGPAEHGELAFHIH